jgi:hypothetical protein
VDELRSLLAQLIVKEMSEVSILNIGVGGSALSFANDLVATQGDLKKHAEEALVFVEVDSI